jgi:hypothetical protein
MSKLFKTLSILIVDAFLTYATYLTMPISSEEYNSNEYRQE